MHYANGREAKEGDQVVGRNCSGKVIAGSIHSLQPGNTSCNAQVAVAIPGGVRNDYMTIGDLYHAEDAYHSMIGIVNRPVQPEAA